MEKTSRLELGDALKILRGLPENSADTMVTDPPAGIGFMGLEWDKNRGGRDQWIAWLSEIMAEALRVLKPGAHALVWALPRTSHWTALALEDAGFEVRDCIYHVFGTGFPKSLDISKALDREAGAKRKRIGRKIFADGTIQHTSNANEHEGRQRPWRDKSIEEQATAWDSAPATPAADQWSGWGTALKPAVECWWLCRKPISEKTVAKNVLKWGTGGINIDDYRIFADYFNEPGRGEKWLNSGRDNKKHDRPSQVPDNQKPLIIDRVNHLGRFPSHLIHDGSPEVIAEFEKAGQSKNSRQRIYKKPPCPRSRCRGADKYREYYWPGESNPGSAARFFYCAKASASERNAGLEGMLMGDPPESGRTKHAPRRENSLGNPRANHHPTVKPLALMTYLIKLITPPGGLILDPFMGSGSTGVAADKLDLLFIGIEIDPEYLEIARRRIKNIAPLFIPSVL